MRTISSGRWYSHRVITSSSSAIRAKSSLQTREVVGQAKSFRGLEPAASMFFQSRALATENGKSLASKFQDMVASLKDVKDVDNMVSTPQQRIDGYGRYPTGLCLYK